MGTIKQKIEALKFEREGYVTFDKTDRVEAVDAELKHWKAIAKKHGGDAEAEPLSPTEQKRALADGVIPESEAAKEEPALDGEQISNDLAAQHASETKSVIGGEIVTEAEVIDNAPEPGEASNDLAAEHRSEAEPAGAEPNITSEAEVIAEIPDGDKLAAPKKRTTKDSTPRTTR